MRVIRLSGQEKKFDDICSQYTNVTDRQTDDGRTDIGRQQKTALAHSVVL